MSVEVSLFVYGSFCEGMVHYDRISERVTEQYPATIKGSVFRLEVGYPVYMDDGGDTIEGTVVRLAAPDVFFRLLDEFHGFSPLTPEKSLFRKIEVEAVASDGATETVKVYAVNPAKLPKSAKYIKGGQWRENLQDNKALTEILTSRQMDYVRRLGASTGRDIVPIDLDLYRELMKLDIIVDKGRRLALSKLGKEVYRYLG